MNSTLEVVNLPPEVINALKRYEMSPLHSNEVIFPMPRPDICEEVLLPTSEFEAVYGKVVEP